MDNHASFVIARIREAEQLEGKASDWHNKARAAWEMWNIPSATDKSVANAFTAKELGCFIDGRAGTLGTTTQRRLDAIALTLHLVSCLTSCTSGTLPSSHGETCTPPWQECISSLCWS